jgi:hypothetical protein
MLTHLNGRPITLADLKAAYWWLGKSQTQAKRRLKDRGWTNRSAAAVLGCTYQHLSCVLNGHRESRRVLEAIEGLPERRTA